MHSQSANLGKTLLRTAFLRLLVSFNAAPSISNWDFSVNAYLEDCTIPSTTVSGHQLFWGKHMVHAFGLLELL
jgi:hypothetical protein